jgi:hypothetical protein
MAADGALAVTGQLAIYAIPIGCDDDISTP